MSAILQSNGLWEYRLQAPDLATLSRALAAIQQAGLVGFNVGPGTMLGDLVVVDAANTVNPRFPLFRYGVGTAARTYKALDGTTATQPARGAPGVFYVAILAAADPATLPVDPIALGLAWSNYEASSAVLGDWF